MWFPIGSQYELTMYLAGPRTVVGDTTYSFFGRFCIAEYALKQCRPIVFRLAVRSDQGWKKS